MFIKCFTGFAQVTLEVKWRKNALSPFLRFKKTGCTTKKKFIGLTQVQLNGLLLTQMQLNGLFHLT